jgi:Spy/CpxP family protein refolding chaperone
MSARHKLWKIMGVGLIITGLSSSGVYAQERVAVPDVTGWMPYGAGSMLPMILRGVNLTIEQDLRIQEIMVAQRPTFQRLNKQLQAAHTEMANKLFAPGELRTDDLTSHVQKIGQLRGQQFQEGLKVMLEIRGVLTHEQLVKASEVKQRLEALRRQ